MKDRQIGVIMGGPARDGSLSLASGERVARALEGAGYSVSPLVLDEASGGIDVLTNSPIDVAFLALHDQPGARGSVQGLLELAGVPFTGSGLLASALAADQLKSKELFRLHGLRPPQYYVLTAEGQSDLEEIHGAFGYPARVRPRRSRAALGAPPARNLHELARATGSALEVDGEVVVERMVTGNEIAVALLDDRVLGALELGADGFRVATQSPARWRGIMNLAEQAATALGVRGVCQVNLLVTDEENEYVLGVDPLPPLTAESAVPQIAARAGFGFLELCEAMLSRALSTSSRQAELHGALLAEVDAITAVAEVELYAAVGESSSTQVSSLGAAAPRARSRSA